MIFAEPPFNMLITGITNCGMTHYALDLLEKPIKINSIT